MVVPFYIHLISESAQFGNSLFENLHEEKTGFNRNRYYVFEEITNK